MKSKKSILVTCAGGYVYPEIIENLRGHDDYEFRIVGCDSSALSVGFSFCDGSYIVPNGDNEGYVGEILRICRKEEINYVLPLSDEETFAVSREKEMF